MVIAMATYIDMEDETSDAHITGSTTEEQSLQTDEVLSGNQPWLCEMPFKITIELSSSTSGLLTPPVIRRLSCCRSTNNNQ